MASPHHHGNHYHHGTSATSPFAPDRSVNPVVMSYIREDWIRGQLSSRKSEYSANKDVTVFTGTWNVNGKKPPSDAGTLKPWLVHQDASIVAIGFQEIVDLNAVNVVVNNASATRSAAWKTLLTECLSDSYTAVAEKHLVGILLLVFVKSTLLSDVSEIQSQQAGVGVMGMMGNKGGVSIRFLLNQTSFCFTCAHLAAHRENVSGRNADYANILQKTEFHEHQHGSNTSLLENNNTTRRSSASSILFNTNNHHHTSDNFNKGYGILDHDYVFWIGDLNYRLTEDVSIEQAFRHVEASDFAFLSDHDQLNLERCRKRSVFHGFIEGSISSFRPTYKFQPGTSFYERRAEKKSRAPAWCDRILFKSSSSVSIVDYTSTDELCLSDHKPVRGVFVTSVCYEIPEKRATVSRDIMHQLDKWENENMPKISIATSGGILSFNDVRYNVPNTQVLTVENTGSVVAHFRFIPKLEESRFCKSWLRVLPSYGMIPPNESIDIQVQVIVNREIAAKLTSNKTTLDDTLILRVENGRDHFVIVSGKYLPSCFGMSLESLVNIKSPVREMTSTSTSEVLIDLDDESSEPQKIPKELWRIIDDLFKSIPAMSSSSSTSSNNIWQRVSHSEEEVLIREALDTGNAFPENHSPSSMVQVLLSFLSSLQTPVIPLHLIGSQRSFEGSREIMNGGGNDDDPMQLQLNGRAVLNGLPPVHYNVFIYLISFLRELVAKDCASADVLASALAPVITSSGSSDKRNYTTIGKLLLHFLTTSVL